MKSKRVLVVAALAIGAGVIMWQGSVLAPAVAGETAALTTVAAVTPAVGDQAEYVGDNKCKMCHFKVFKTWKKTSMYNAVETLLPGKDSEAKTKHGLDVSKDYSQDEKCVACHVTGLGKPGGYEIHDLSDKAADKKFKGLGEIGCEVCHGPGSNYIKLHEEIMKSKRQYTREEMYAAGMNKIDESTCTQCHNDKSPTFESFNFDEMKQKVHEHETPKQRKG